MLVSCLQDEGHWFLLEISGNAGLEGPAQALIIILALVILESLIQMILQISGS